MDKLVMKILLNGLMNKISKKRQKYFLSFLFTYSNFLYNLFICKNYKNNSINDIAKNVVGIINTNPFNKNTPISPK